MPHLTMLAPPHPEATMSFLDHLEELRRRILWCLAALVVGSVIGFVVTTQLEVIHFLTRPVRPLLENGRLAYLNPTEPFMVTLKVSVFVGVILALPVIFWQFWKFVAPGLVAKEKKIVVPSVFASVALFVGGAALAFFMALPLGLKFFFSFADEALEPVITINQYFGFAMQVTLMFGIVFETPLVILILTYAGVVSPRTLMKYRRHAIAAIAVISAIMTPADVFSMVIMMVPLYLLYETSVTVGWVIERRREKAAAAEAAGGHA
ncbi:MAG: twin-arginine translocase subunit TatC [Gemmatimonadota bacterium]